MMTKTIKKRMYRDIAMLVFLLLAAAAITVASKADAAGLPNEKPQVIQLAPEP